MAFFMFWSHYFGCPGKVKADTEEEALEHQSPFSGAAKEMKIEGAPEIQGPFPEDDKEVGGAPEIRSPCPVEEGASIEERAPELRGPGPRAANLQEEKIMEASKNNLQADKSQVKPPKPHPNFASYLNGQYWKLIFPTANPWKGGRGQQAASFLLVVLVVVARSNESKDDL